MKVVPAAWEKIARSPEVSSPKSNVCVKNDSNRLPINYPRSSNRVTMNAFFEAAIASGFV